MSKIVVVGAGRVGATFAYTLAGSGLVRDIVLVDVDRDRAEGEAMDIAQSVPFARPVDVVAGDVADVAGATITVITAGASQRPGESRLALLQRNADVVGALVPQVARLNPHGLVLVATNPVDALTFLSLEASGLPASKVFGSGTVLDSARLRVALAAELHVDPRNLHAYVLGEHGDSEFVAWSAARVATMRLEDHARLVGAGDVPFDAIEQRVRSAAYEIIRRKGATNFAIAAALTRIVEAVVRDEASILTVSARVDGYHGIDGVCLGVPAIVDASGIRRVLPIPLDDGEIARLRRSAQTIRDAIAGLRPRA